MTFLLAATGAGILLAGCGPQAARAPQSIVRQVDHVLIASSDANQLFALLSDTLQLPVAWPMAEYGNFSSGGVAVGNVNLEIIRDDQSSGGVRSRWTGFALEPEPLENAIGELKARGIAHGWAVPFRSKQADGSMALRWTTVSLRDVSSERTGVFICQYAHNVAERRSRLADQLRSRDGGPLSILSVKEIVYGVVDAKRMEEHWQKLLNPTQASSPGVWPIGAGPSIRVIQTQQSGICELTLTVKSLQRARQFLQENALLEGDQAGKLTIGGPVMKGLNITLVE